MISQDDELYKEVLLDHARHPRNYGVPSHPNVIVESENPQCGDEITLYLILSEDHSTISSSHFSGQACAICTASASMLTTKIRNITLQAAELTAKQFLSMIKRPPDAPSADLSGPLGSLAALDGVRKFPARVKCAALPWRALQQALQQASTGGGTSSLEIRDE
ncbi:MAG: SUF system NifU family Fe-S cluster assembly protein [Chthoniobacterales bacterium]|nr:SUF system NifU family Fe-S cluster assembly protein [Chthoniobacterales bacterium]